MPIPSPSTPSAGTAISAVRLNPTQNNKAFYVYSGEISVDASEVTMISVNDIGPRDIFLALEVMCSTATDKAATMKVKVNGQIALSSYSFRIDNIQAYGFDEIRMIIPANTSLEVTIEMSSGSATWTVAGYGNFIEGRLP